ncbi:MAG: crossover junction endodeoxyribonuclease RuvC [Candidatus Paceibacterota bacterium]|jgi:crossover junction endodeoxyribonuclease RuvC
MKILAIDPGYERLGIAIMEKESGSKERIIFSDCLQTSAKEIHASRLAKIAEALKELIETYSPTILATEKLFFSSNQKTALLVAEARGVVLSECVRLGLKVFEYHPSAIKIAVTGHGKSDKKQVIDMVKKLVKIDKTIKYDDEWDAVAVGITYFATDANTLDKYQVFR